MTKRDEDRSLTWWAQVLFILGALAIGGLLYWWAFVGLLSDTQPGGFKLAENFDLLAGLVVVTLGLERLLDPFARFIGPSTDAAKDELTEAAVAQKTGTSDPPPPASSDVAKAQGKVDRARRATSILLWGVASGLGFVFAAATNILLMRAIAGPASTLPPVWLDLFVTGLVVGAGTKPVHDLVSRIEKSKSTAEDNAAQTTADPA